MSAPADRPLSLARMRALPVGALVRDRRGLLWYRYPDARTGAPGWFRSEHGYTASYTTLHTDHRPLQLVDADEVAP